MPLYEAECLQCGRALEYHRPVGEAMCTPRCPVCDVPTQKVIRTAPRGYVKGNFDAFHSPVDGTLITSERALRNHNARNGVRNIHDGYDEATVLSGNFGPKPPVVDKKDVQKDIIQACQMLEQGHKPKKEVAEDGYE